MNTREHIFFILFAICTIPFGLIALPFIIFGALLIAMGIIPLLAWNYAVFPLLIWFEEWFVRKGYYIDLKGKDNG